MAIEGCTPEQEAEFRKVIGPIIPPMIQIFSLLQKSSNELDRTMPDLELLKKYATGIEDALLEVVVKCKDAGV